MEGKEEDGKKKKRKILKTKELFHLVIFSSRNFKRVILRSLIIVILAILRVVLLSFCGENKELEYVQHRWTIVVNAPGAAKLLKNILKLDLILLCRDRKKGEEK